jgi:hypothetical protein
MVGTSGLRRIAAAGDRRPPAGASIVRRPAAARTAALTVAGQQPIITRFEFFTKFTEFRLPYPIPEDI